MRYLLTILFLCISMPSLAEDRLTEEGIRAFYKRAANVQLEGAAPALAFYEKHIHDDTKMVMNTITNIQGTPPQKLVLNHDKKSLLRDTRTGYKTSQLESLENKVLAIEIAEDGQSATVKDTTFGISIMNVPTPNGITPFKVEQSMLCDGDVILSEGGIVQAKNGTCNIEVTMKPVK